ncbi:MAG: L-rhamnonate dehydratase [Acidobacteria bacterium]|nr:L-rhamnonate dehydratase [Acidobacteriota bacterium]
MMASRRQFVRQISWAAAALALPRIKIVAVKATPVLLGEGFRTSAPKFTSDYDPLRWRYRGPFPQLAGAVVVEIRTDQGIVGYGLGGGGGAAAYVIEKHLSDLLVGANPLNVELLWDQIYSSTLLYGRRGLVIMAMSGIDLALWDIAGKHAGKPVYQLLGGAVKDRVPVYYTGAIERGIHLGVKAFKLSAGVGVREGREGMRRLEARLREARQTIGPDAELMIDCICTWDVPYTFEMAERLADVRLAFIEEPLSPDDIDGYAALCRQIRGTRIASGEHEYTRFGFQMLLKHNAVHILQPDLTWCGGLTDTRRVAAMAAAQSLPIVPHRGGSVYGLSLILATPNSPLAESFGLDPGDSDLMRAMTPRFEAGFYFPSDRSGFGAEITENLVRKHARP